jgi:hypothetical protein
VQRDRALIYDVPMTALATRLGETRHTSVLLRRARALGLADLADLIRLAVQRGCDHYRGIAVDGSEVQDPGADNLTDEELAIFALARRASLQSNGSPMRCTVVERS